MKRIYILSIMIMLGCSGGLSTIEKGQFFYVENHADAERIFKIYKWKEVRIDTIHEKGIRYFRVHYRETE